MFKRNTNLNRFICLCVNPYSLFTFWTFNTVALLLMFFFSWVLSKFCSNACMWKTRTYKVRTLSFFVFFTLSVHHDVSQNIKSPMSSESSQMPSKLNPSFTRTPEKHVCLHTRTHTLTRLNRRLLAESCSFLTTYIHASHEHAMHLIEFE